MRGYLVRLARRIGLIDPPKLPEIEIRKDAYEAGYAAFEADGSTRNPHPRGSINYLSWKQGNLDSLKREQRIW